MRKTGPDKATVGLLLKRGIEGMGTDACECCGWNAREQIHHRKARGMGGTRSPAINFPSNLFYICFPCHADIESNRTDALEKGWLVRNAANPELVPILYQGYVSTLDNAGGVTVAH